MDAKELKKAYNSMLKMQKEVEKLSDEIQAFISKKSELDDISVFYQPSDGWVLEYESSNAMLYDALNIIFEKGYLSEDDYNSIVFN